MSIASRATAADGDDVNERTPFHWDKRHCGILDLWFTVGGSSRNAGHWFEVISVHGSGGGFEAFGDGFANRGEAIKAAEKWFYESEIQALANRFIGWFDNPHETEPAYDPGISMVDCPFCNESLGRHSPTNRLMTISIVSEGVDGKSLFYRAHKDCYQRDAERVSKIEDEIIGVMAWLTQREDA